MLSRKFKSIAIIVISIIIVFIVVLNHKSELEITSSNQLYITDSQREQLMATHALSPSVLTTNLIFDNENLIYDSSTNTFYYSLIENSNSRFTPSVISDDGLTVALYGAAISDESIAANTDFEILIYNDSTVSISTLKCTTLPVMNITIYPETISDYGLDDNMDILSYVGSSIYLFDNRSDFDGKTRQIVSDAKIRRHGQTTAGFPLKGYRIGLLEDRTNIDGNTHKENLLGLRNDDDWILTATYRDYEKVRNVFSMNLWHESFNKENEWNVNNSTQYKFIELFFNGRYHGIYGLCYRLDAKEFKPGEGETTFKKKDWSMSELDTALTIDENTGSATLPGYVLKDGDIAGFNDLLELYVHMNYSPDPALIRMTSDVGNSIDLWLYYKLTQAVDNISYGNVKNMYVTVKNSDSGIHGHKLLFTPWDMDQSWRYTSPDTTGLYNHPNFDLPIGWGTVHRLQEVGDPTINQEIKERYQVLRGSVWSDENIVAMLDEYEKQIYDSGAFARTQAKYPEGSYNDASIKLSDFKAYALKRLQCMDEYISSF